MLITVPQMISVMLSLVCREHGPKGVGRDQKNLLTEMSGMAVSV